MSERYIDILAAEWEANKEDSNKYIVVEEGVWTQGYKYQLRDTIIQTEDGKHYIVQQSRQGSYHTDWTYLPPSVQEVILYTETITVTKWEII